MISNQLARALRDQTIPQSERFPATVTLLPDSGSPTTIAAQGCWWKPLDVTLDNYGGILLEGSERIINIPAEWIHTTGAPAEARQEIRRRDRVTVGSVSYLVLSAGLRSVSSRWECLVREIEA